MKSFALWLPEDMAAFYYPKPPGLGSTFFRRRIMLEGTAAPTNPNLALKDKIDR